MAKKTSDASVIDSDFTNTKKYIFRFSITKFETIFLFHSGKIFRVVTPR